MRSSIIALVALASSGHAFNPRAMSGVAAAYGAATVSTPDAVQGSSQAAGYPAASAATVVASQPTSIATTAQMGRNDQPAMNWLPHWAHTPSSSPIVANQPASSVGAGLSTAPAASYNNGLWTPPASSPNAGQATPPASSYNDGMWTPPASTPNAGLWTPPASAPMAASQPTSAASQPILPTSAPAAITASSAPAASTPGYQAASGAVPASSAPVPSAPAAIPAASAPGYQAASGAIPASSAPIPSAPAAIPASSAAAPAPSAGAYQVPSNGSLPVVNISATAYNTVTVPGATPVTASSQTVQASQTGLPATPSQAYPVDECQDLGGIAAVTCGSNGGGGLMTGSEISENEKPDGVQGRAGTAATTLATVVASPSATSPSMWPQGQGGSPDRKGLWKV